MHKNLLNQSYFSFTHSYINYTNNTWRSTHHSKLESLFRHQKHVAEVINFKDKFFHAKPLLRKLHILSVYGANVFQTFCFMLNCKIGITSSIFSDINRQNPTKKYPQHSIGTLSKPYYQRKYDKYIKSFCGLHLWNKILTKNPSIADI